MISEKHFSDLGVRKIFSNYPFEVFFPLQKRTDMCIYIFIYVIIYVYTYSIKITPSKKPRKSVSPIKEASDAAWRREG